MQIVLSVTVKLVDLSAAIMHAIVFVAIMQLKVSAPTLHKLAGKHLNALYQVWISLLL